MFKSYRVPIAIIVLLVIIQVLFELYRPKPINWDMTYEKKDKIPHGCYIAHHLLLDHFKGVEKSVIHQPIYNLLSKNTSLDILTDEQIDNYEGDGDDTDEANSDSPIDDNYEATEDDSVNEEEEEDLTQDVSIDKEDEEASPQDDSIDKEEEEDLTQDDSVDTEENTDSERLASESEAADTIPYTPFADTHKGEQYLFITKDFAPDDLDVSYLWRFAHTGGTVFIAAEHISDSLATLLHVNMDWQMGGWDDTSTRQKIIFTHPQLIQKPPYTFKQLYTKTYFSRLDSTNTTILGGTDTLHPNFVRVACGIGAFYLHSSPDLFTNYNAIQDSGALYITQAFAHLPAATTLIQWDEYYKPNRLPDETPLRYVLSQEPLRWAIYLTVLTIAFLLIIQTKRKQRPIPVIQPLKNSTLEFAQTIGLLYYQNADHKDIAQKKIIYFADSLRTRLFLPPIQFDRKYYELIAQKTQLPYTDIEAIFKLIIQVKTQVAIEPETLLLLNQKIDAFYTSLG